MSQALLVGVDPVQVGLAEASPEAPELCLEVAASAEEALARLGRPERPIDAVVIGPTVAQPVALAQAVHAADRDAVVLVVSTPERHALVARAVQFAPFVGDDIRCYSLADVGRLARDIRGAAVRGQQRHAFRASLAAATGRLAATARPAPPLAIQYLGRLLERAPIGVALLDAQGRIVGLNRRAGDILGRGETEVLGTPLEALFPRPHQDRLRELVARAARAEADEALLPEVLERAPAEDRLQHLEVIAAGLTGREGERGAMVLLQDVTERVTNEQAREAFLAAAAHDLKTPLAGIKAHAQLLTRLVKRAGAQTDPRRLLDGLAGIDASATRMSALIGELLDLARLRMARPLDLDRRPTDLVALARTAARTHQRTTERHTITVDAAGPELVGEWDAMRLERVLDNLLGNAVKYSPRGGPIVVRVWAEQREGEPWAGLAVRDQGIGIPSADLPHVFERFHRAANVLGHVEGTGIGLASARHIVASHGGWVDVESREAEGSSFTAWLPLRARPGRESGAASPPAAPFTE